MILGIGTDIVDIRRIERLLARFPERFAQRIFTRMECDAVHTRRGQAIAASFAKRFATKEACAKALGTGFNGIGWHEIETKHLPGGAPSLSLHGVARARLNAMTPGGYTPVLHVSLADEYPYAQAYVIISAEPKGHAVE